MLQVIKTQLVMKPEMWVRSHSRRCEDEQQTEEGVLGGCGACQKGPVRDHGIEKPGGWKSERKQSYLQKSRDAFQEESG